MFKSPLSVATCSVVPYPVDARSATRLCFCIHSQSMAFLCPTLLDLASLARESVNRIPVARMKFCQSSAHLNICRRNLPHRLLVLLLAVGESQPTRAAWCWSRKRVNIEMLLLVFSESTA
ncbi:unnamed protein product [Protopolystoma xenopodis]|uniref:Uncharacterized protein n=1 Tax=Protopolystoma xenopodis TaxID=117903 RepID=A0A3S5CP18_9PLAT|nr:unnamed protein product [Protopolystoma xenopodis]